MGYGKEGGPKGKGKGEEKKVERIVLAYYSLSASTPAPEALFATPAARLLYVVVVFMHER